MSICVNPECCEKPVYLSEFCWKHMMDENRAKYSEKLSIEIKRVRIIKNENFYAADLRGMELPQYTSLIKCIFTKADLSESVLQRVNLQGCKFDNSRINDCHCEYSDFRKIIGVNTSIKNADVRGTHFNGALLQNVDFTGSDLRDANFIEADMVGAMLQDVELYSARLFNTRLRKENFCNFTQKRPLNIHVGDEFSSDRDRIHETPLRARYVYSALKNNFHSIGEYADERWARSKEREMERKRLFMLAFLGDRYSDSLALEHWQSNEMDQLYESRTEACQKWLIRCFLSAIGYCESPLSF